MKHIILVLTFYFLVATSEAQTNPYSPFPDSTFWRVDVHCQWAQSNCNEFYYYHYYLGGDTVINSVLYDKIMRDSVVLEGIGGPPCLLYPWASFTGYMGALKQDSIAKKVYMVWQNTTNDTLIYDYNLLVGDTIKGLLTNGCIMVINNIDSVLIGNEYRRRWNFNTCNEGPGYVISGIGSDNGFIERINSPGFCYSSLICVKNDTTNIYSSNIPSAYGCQLIYTNTDELFIDNSINVYPNPFSTTTTINLNKVWKNMSLLVFNSYGQKVRQFDNLNSQQIIIHRDNLPSGLYFYRISNSHDTIYENKFVIIDQ